MQDVEGYVYSLWGHGMLDRNRGFKFLRPFFFILRHQIKWCVCVCMFMCGVSVRCACVNITAVFVRSPLALADWQVRSDDIYVEAVICKQTD